MIFLSKFIEPEKGNKQRGKDIIPEPLKEKIVATDLSGWTYLPRKGTVAVDSVLGRIAFPTQHAPKNGVWVSYCYGFSADIGGGEYDRALSQPAKSEFYRISPPPVQHHPLRHRVTAS